MLLKSKVIAAKCTDVSRAVKIMEKGCGFSSKRWILIKSKVIAAKHADEFTSPKLFLT